jgi:hypothetical protein
MKIKLWQFEYDFDQKDAQVVLPVLLLVLGLAFTHFNKEVLWGATVVYYLLYFFLKPAFSAIQELSTRFLSWHRFRCPACKSRELIMQGYQGYHSDEHYAYYLCNRCHETVVLVGERLLKHRSRPEIVNPPF